MEKYHFVEKIGVVAKAVPKTRYWLRYNKDGSVDLCSTKTDHPEYRAKMLAKTVKLREEKRAKRLELRKQREVDRLKAKLGALGVRV